MLGVDANTLLYQVPGGMPVSYTHLDVYKRQGLMDVTLEKIKSMVDSKTIIGNPINMADGTLVLPISKGTFGCASGGADFPSKTTKDPVSYTHLPSRR